MQRRWGPAICEQFALARSTWKLTSLAVSTHTRNANIMYACLRAILYACIVVLVCCVLRVVCLELCVVCVCVVWCVRVCFECCVLCVFSAEC